MASADVLCVFTEPDSACLSISDLFPDDPAALAGAAMTGETIQVPAARAPANVNANKR